MQTNMLLRTINTSNIETIEVLDKTIVKDWEYTNTLYYKSRFLNRKKKINVDLKWYYVQDFKYAKIFADSDKEALKGTQQIETDEELLEYIGIDKYTIIDRKLYVKPRIKITFISGQNQYIYFDNSTKAIEYIADLKRKMEKETLIYC